MKILYLKLKNFKPIYASLGLKKIEIDFTRMVNDILLFIGDNGSCKTFIFSNIHPFAGLGSVDIRNGQDLILDEKDGEKEAHYIHNGDIYKIKHHYLYQKNKGRKIHSYIEKNGIELNSNGLVGSFNDVIEKEFGIDSNFLKIVRLGSNVTNLVNHKSTERKEFVAKLLSEVDVYNEMYKNSANDSRSLKVNLKNVTEKIKKLNISDEILFRNELETLQNKLDILVSDRETSIKNFYKFKGEIESLVNSSIGDMEIEISLIEKELNMKHDLLRDHLALISKKCYIHNTTDEETINNYNTQLQNIEIELARINVKCCSIAEQIVDIENEKIDLESKLKAFKELDQISSIEDDLKMKKTKYDELDKLYHSFTPKCTKEDILQDFVVIENIINQVRNTFEFDQKAILLYNKYFNKNKNVKKSCMNKLNELSVELSLCNKLDRSDEIVDVICVPSECKVFNKCNFYLNYDFKVQTRTINDIERETEIVYQCLSIDDILTNIKNILLVRKNIFPYEIKFENILLDIMNRRLSFFTFDEITQYISFLENYNEYIELKGYIGQIESELNGLYNQRSTIDESVVKRLNKIVLDHIGLKERYSLLKGDKTRLEIKGDRIFDELNDFKEWSKNFRIVKETKEEITTLREKNRGVIKKKGMLDNYKENEKQFNANIIMYDRNIKDMNDKIYNNKLALSEFDSLNKEKKKIEEDYDELELARDAVSSTTGLPLIIIKMYLKNTQMAANAIVQKVYDDKIQLCDFIINEKEFRIPYMKNGILVNDVAMASQGELAIISLALSFAILEQFSASYNILLLDEVDGTLDKENKEKFLRVLEFQMKRINCEQLFIITHNQLFENYPVDVFITLCKDNISETFKHINIINQ